jgi:hypothetical protein
MAILASVPRMTSRRRKVNGVDFHYIGFKPALATPPRENPKKIMEPLIEDSLRFVPTA